MEGYNARTSVSVYKHFAVCLLIALLSTSMPAADAQDSPARATASNPRGAERSAYTAASKWQESEKSFYHDILLKGQGRYDTLIVPFQVNGFGVDAIGRSLMTRYLAKSLAAATHKPLPDTSLVELTLGDRARQYNATDIYRLANGLKVKTVLWCYVSHDNNGKFSFSIRPQRGNPGELGPQSPATTVEWKDLSFSDDILPSAVFQDHIKEVIGRLGMGDPGRIKSVTSSKAKNLALPDNIVSLIKTKSVDPVENAYRLQLIAMLYPRTASREKERLFERSLVGIADVRPPTADTRLLTARAYFYLQRRPAAVRALKGGNSSAEMALQAVLDGNLPEMDGHVKKIKSPMANLLAQIELDDLRAGYGYPVGKSLEQLVIQYPAWKFYFVRRLKDNDSWYLQNNLEVKLEQDRILPIAGFSLETLAQGKLVLGDHQILAKFETSYFEHARKIWQNKATDWCCANEPSSPTMTDISDLLTFYGLANAQDAVRHQLSVQGKAMAAMQALQPYWTIYDGHPGLTQLRSEVLTELAVAASGQAADNLKTEANNENIRACYLSGGQNSISARVFEILDNVRFSQGTGKYLLPDDNNLMYLANLYRTDFPPRSYWSMKWGLPKGEYLNPKYNDEHVLRYTSNDFTDGLQMPYKNMLFKQAGKAKEMLAANAHRFRGHPERLAFLAEEQGKTGNFLGMEKLYRDEIGLNNPTWFPYSNLGTLLVSQGRFKEASDVFLSYPGFHVKDMEDPVSLSNYAYEAGSALFWRGAYAEATPLYKLAAGYKTGSGASLASAVRLNLMERNFPFAAEYTRQRAVRYQDVYAYRDYIQLAHIMGKNAEGWAVFDSLVSQLDDPEIWMGALVGHRVEGKSDKELIQWIKQERIKIIAKPSAIGPGLPTRYVFMALTMDRPPNVLLAEAVFEPGYPLLAQFAKAYLAMRAGDYSRANEIFQADLETAAHHGQVPLSSLHTKIIAGLADYASPYYARVLVKTGKADALPKNLLLPEVFSEKNHYVDNSQLLTQMGLAYKTLLTKAILAAGKKEHVEALRYLQQAFNIHPYTERRIFDIWYELVETCEWLYDNFGDERYRDLGLKWARSHQVIQPMYSWAYAFEAKYTQDKHARKRALALALYLDRDSERIARIPEKEKQEARLWLKHNNPFTKPVAQSMKDI